MNSINSFYLVQPVKHYKNNIEAINSQHDRCSCRQVWLVSLLRLMIILSHDLLSFAFMKLLKGSFHDTNFVFYDELRLHRFYKNRCLYLTCNIFAFLDSELKLLISQVSFWTLISYLPLFFFIIYNKLFFAFRYIFFGFSYFAKNRLWHFYNHFLSTFWFCFG